MILSPNAISGGSSVIIDQSEDDDFQLPLPDNVLEAAKALVLEAIANDELGLLVEVINQNFYDLLTLAIEEPLDTPPPDVAYDPFLIALAIKELDENGEIDPSITQTILDGEHGALLDYALTFQQNSTIGLTLVNLSTTQHALPAEEFEAQIIDPLALAENQSGLHTYLQIWAEENASAFDASRMIISTWPSSGTGETIVTYSFLQYVPDFYANDPLFVQFTDFYPPTPEEQEIVLTALEDWDNASGLRFVPAQSGQLGDINFGAYGYSEIARGAAQFPVVLEAPESLDVSFLVEEYNDPDLAGEVAFLGNESLSLDYYTAAHEIGHSIGLLHPHNLGLAPVIDNSEQTVMSYDCHYFNLCSEINSLGPLDIRLAQQMYGPDDPNVDFDRGPYPINLLPEGKN